MNDRLLGAVLGGSYRLDRLLGQGGMGRVYQATHLRLARKRYAVKLLHPAALVDAEAYARFRREAEVATAIGHPGIVEVIDFNVSDDVSMVSHLPWANVGALERRPAGRAGSPPRGSRRDLGFLGSTPAPYPCPPEQSAQAPLSSGPPIHS